MLIRTKVLVVANNQRELTPEEIEDRKIQSLINGTDFDENELEYEEVEYEYSDAIVDLSRELIFVDSNGSAVCILPFTDQVIIEENIDDLYEKLNKSTFNKILTFVKLHMSDFFRMFAKQK